MLVIWAIGEFIFQTVGSVYTDDLCKIAVTGWERFLRHRFQRKPWESDSDMHHGTCVTHLPCRMHVGVVNQRWPGNVPGIPGASTNRNLRIWQQSPSQKCIIFWRVIWQEAH